MILSILIPAYNEENSIISLLESVNSVKIEDMEVQIVVVDDGSKDRTKELIESRQDLYHEFVNLETNLGKGGAVKAGLSQCKGDYILFQDADLEYDPHEIPKLTSALVKFQPDVLYGSRFLAPQVTRVAYFYNKIGNYLITLFFNCLYNTTFTDIYSCYLCYKRSLINPSELKDEGWSQHAEILCKAVKEGKSFYEVPISYFGRSYEEGKKIRPYHIFGVFSRIFKERFFN